MAKRCVVKVGGCCNPYSRASHCPLTGCTCDLHHHAPEPPTSCERVEASHADGALGHEFTTRVEAVPA